jgi:type VI secretion system protein ImpG
VDPRLLQYYERELRYVREMGAEFAREFPKIAGRLGLEGLECADPYVERLLESFAFLSARVQLRIDAEFPRFTQHLLELLYPHYLAPTPSMAVVQFAPNPKESALAAGFKVPVDTVLRSRLGRREQTACEYRVKHEVTLWPLALERAEYTTLLTDLRDIRVPGAPTVKAMLRLGLRATAGLRFDQLTLDRLPLFLSGNDDVAMRLYEQLLAASVAVVVLPRGRKGGAHTIVREQPCVAALGFEDEHALLPYGPRSFSGYRLLHEYFAFPSRFMFAELRGLQAALRTCPDSQVEILVLLEREDSALEGVISASRLQLFCAPAINLFPRKADRIHLSDRDHEYHVVPDRTRPMDLEIHSVESVVGHGTRAESEREFLPLYAARDGQTRDATGSFYTVARKPRMLSARQRHAGPRSTYVGSEVYLALVDGDGGPYRSDLRQLAVSALCTNRDLPLHMSIGQGPTDFTLQSGAPVEAVRCVAGPSAPRPSFAHGETSWRLLSQLSLNYLSLVSDNDQKGAAALRDMLSLYADLGDPSARKQVQGVRSVRTDPIVRPLPGAGPLSFGRGLAVTLECDEVSFQGSGAFLLGAVLERFFAKYASINSFTETTLRTVQRGEIMRWAMATGRRHVL